MTPVLGSKSKPRSKSGYMLYLTLTNSFGFTNPNLITQGSKKGFILIIESFLSLTKKTNLGEYCNGLRYFCIITRMPNKITNVTPT